MSEDANSQNKLQADAPMTPGSSDGESTSSRMPSSKRLVEVASSPAIAPYLTLIALALVAAVIAITSKPVGSEVLIPHATAVQVDINEATEAELRLLPGIGAKLASDIVAHRLEHGPFRTPEELMQIRGLKSAKFNQIKDYLFVAPK